MRRALNPYANSRPVLTALVLAVCTLVLLGCGPGSSDESILRAEFAIPRAARLVSDEAQPKEAGWFGREGLKITIVFQLSEGDYRAYVARAQAAGTWATLPIPEDVLRRMGAVETAKTSIARSYEAQGKPLPAEGSVYNPTQQQLLERFTASLAPQPGDGLFQVRSAGTDIMRARKTIRREPEQDLNDFMLGMLDHAQQRIIIKVSTSY
ncbi:hypothetical protein [uncultured Thiodictyon sp.]|uniref:hypothetical protein n=1 Tax=uncultured Thiodictyon sp. TaxID=1846217 RepID=UPI0025CC481C|nr:hypothetical protein [uncultured Thiodictyon sp.]